MKIHGKFLPIIGCVLVFLFSVSNGFAGEPLLRSLPLEYSSPVFVKRGEAVATQLDVDAFLADRVPLEARATLLQSAERIGQMLESILLTESFHQLARDRGLLDDPLVKARLYRAALLQLRAIFREKYILDIELADYSEIAREIYLTRPERFKHQNTVSFKHILVTVEPQRTEIEAMQRILEVNQQLIEGERFSDVVAAFSDDPSASSNSGLLESVDPATLVSQIASHLSDAERGEWSDPIRTRFGWHLVRLIDVHEGEEMTWEEARATAEQMARDRHLTTAFERLLRDFQDAPANFSEGSVADLRARYRVTEDAAVGDTVPDIGLGAGLEVP